MDLRGATCLLALADEREDNLRAAFIAARMAPGVPVVVRAFHPSLADQIERNPAGNVQRAYSMAHLSAPFFVGAALLEPEEHNLVTMRLADDYVAVCRLVVSDVRGLLRSHRRQLVGRRPQAVLAKGSCQVVARRGADGWRVCGEEDGEPLREGEEILIGGPLADIFMLVRDHSRRLHSRSMPPEEPDHPATRARRPRMRSPRLTAEPFHAWVQTTTLAFRVLVGLLVVVTIAVALTPNNLAHGFYLWVLTALGNPGPSNATDSEAVVNAVGLLAGGVALGLWISLLSAYFIERRIVEATYRRARRLKDHVVIVGLNDVSLRIAELLSRVGIPYAVVDPSGAPGSDVSRRSLQLINDQIPVLSGVLEESMAVARIDRAAALIACSRSNLLNVEACMRAKGRPEPGRIRTVARIFDDLEASREARALGVDEQIAAVEVAAPAFVDAALNREAIREFDSGDGFCVTGVRWPSGHPVAAPELQRWAAAGVRVLAISCPGEPRLRAPARGMTSLGARDTAILVGPSEAMRDVVGRLGGVPGLSEHCATAPADAS